MEPALIHLKREAQQPRRLVQELRREIGRNPVVPQLDQAQSLQAAAKASSSRAFRSITGM